MKDRFFACLLAAALLAALSACGAGNASEGAQELQAFSSLSVQANAAGIELVSGDGWALEYRVAGALAVSQEGGALTVTQKGSGKLPDGEAGFIRITVPEGTPLDSAALSAAGGGVTIRGVSCTSAAVVAAAGDARFEEVRIGEAEVHVAAGDLFYDGLLEGGSLEVAAGDAQLLFRGDAPLWYLDVGVESGAMRIDADTAESADQAQYVIRIAVASGKLTAQFED